MVIAAVTTPITLMKRKKEKKNTVMANPITRKILSNKSSWSYLLQSDLLEVVQSFIFIISIICQLLFRNPQNYLKFIVVSFFFRNIFINNLILSRFIPINYNAVFMLVA